MTLPSASIVLPVANQEDHLARIIPEYLDALKRATDLPELILAVNNSTDSSLSMCQSLASRSGGLISTLQTPPGWGNAIRHGLERARADVVGFANSARTAPADLALAVRLGLTDRQSLVKGCRRRRTYPALRRAASSAFNLEARLLLGIDVQDVNGNPKVFSRSVIDPTWLEEPGSLLDLELLVVCKREGVPIVEFPVSSTARHGGRSMTTARLALSLCAGPWSLRRRQWRPGLRAASGAGGNGCARW